MAELSIYVPFLPAVDGHAAKAGQERRECDECADRSRRGTEATEHRQRDQDRRDPHGQEDPVEAQRSTSDPPTPLLIHARTAG
jgi:hypothetical protein